MTIVICINVRTRPTSSLSPLAQRNSMKRGKMCNVNVERIDKRHDFRMQTQMRQED